MSDRLNELVEALGESVPETRVSNADLVPPGERPCPICGKHMRSEGFMDVGIDTCAEHGVWLDVGELQSIVREAKFKQRGTSRRQLHEARRAGKVSGIAFGVWSLWLN